MKKSIFLTFIFLNLLGCSNNNEDGYQIPPLSPEAQAQDKFYKSGIYKKLRNIGLDFSCHHFCTQVSQESLEMWELYFDEFAALKGKIRFIEITNQEQVSFTHPIGTYILKLPYNVKKSDLNEIFVAFDRLLLLESELGAEVFVSATKPNFTQAINVLLQNVDDVIPLGFKKIYITTEPTSYSSSLKIADLNVRTLNSSIQTSLERINLFLKAYEKIPNLDINVYSSDVETYSFLERLIAKAQDIISVIGHYDFSFAIDSFVGDLYLAGKSFGRHSVLINSNRSLQEALDLLNYDTYLIRLGERLSPQFRNYKGVSSYSKYPDCFEKIRNLETAIERKGDKIESVFIDYGVYMPLKSTFFKDNELFLRCAEDTLEEMLDVIQSIE